MGNTTEEEGTTDGGCAQGVIGLRTVRKDVTDNAGAQDAFAGRVGKEEEEGCETLNQWSIIESLGPLITTTRNPYQRPTIAHRSCSRREVPSARREAYAYKLRCSGLLSHLVVYVRAIAC